VEVQNGKDKLDDRQIYQKRCIYNNIKKKWPTYGAHRNQVEFQSWWRYRMAKTHKMTIFAGHFPQKSHTISASFAERDLKDKQSYGSLPPCNAYIHTLIHTQIHTSTHKCALTCRDSHAVTRRGVCCNYTYVCVRVCVWGVAW